MTCKVQDWSWFAPVLPKISKFTSQFIPDQTVYFSSIINWIPLKIYLKVYVGSIQRYTYMLLSSPLIYVQLYSTVFTFGPDIPDQISAYIRAYHRCQTHSKSKQTSAPTCSRLISQNCSEFFILFEIADIFKCYFLSVE